MEQLAMFNEQTEIRRKRPIMNTFTTFSLKVVKEKTMRYEINKKVTKPEIAYEIATEILGLDEQPEESMWLMTLDVKANITGLFEVSKGTLNSSLVHPREIFKRAMLQNAANIIIMHNHPSGDPTPSKDDIEITRRVYEAGKILGIELYDHIIIGDGVFISLKEKNLF